MVALLLHAGQPLPFENAAPAPHLVTRLPYTRFDARGTLGGVASQKQALNQGDQVFPRPFFHPLIQAAYRIALKVNRLPVSIGRR